MKNFLLSFCILISLFASSQNPTFPVIPRNPGDMSDTVITKDPLNPKREYWVIRFDNKATKAQGFMLNGERDGPWREYTSGNYILTKMVNYEHGRKNGSCVTLSVIGQVMVDETFLNDTLEGVRTKFQNNGRIWAIENYVHGVLNGEKRSYYDNTKIQEESTYLDGNKNGVTTWYTQEGKVTLQYTYVKGILQGLAKEFDANGNVKKEGNYVNGEEDGEWKVYEEKALKKKIIYKKGEVVKETEVKN